MLVMTGGRERAKTDYARLLDASGYQLEKVIPNLAPQTLLTAVVAYLLSVLETGFF
jgi:hypothetical protein